MMLLMDYLLCCSHRPDSPAIKRYLHPSWADTETPLIRDAPERQRLTKAGGWVQLCRFGKDLRSSSVTR